MTTANQAYRQAAQAAKSVGDSLGETAKSIGDSLGEQVSDFAADVSREAGKQFSRAQHAAADVYEEAHAASKEYPHMTLALAAGLGFLFGVMVASRR